MPSFIFYFPYIFFFLSLFFRINENAVGLLEEFDIEYDPSKNTYGITIKTMKQIIRNTQDPNLIRSLKRCLLQRRLMYFFLFLAFLSVIVIGCFNTMIEKGIIN